MRRLQKSTKQTHFEKMNNTIANYIEISKKTCKVLPLNLHLAHMTMGLVGEYAEILDALRTAPEKYFENDDGNPEYTDEYMQWQENYVKEIGDFAYYLFMMTYDIKEDKPLFEYGNGKFYDFRAGLDIYNGNPLNFTYAVHTTIDIGNLVEYLKKVIFYEKPLDGAKFFELWSIVVKSLIMYLDSGEDLVVTLNDILVANTQKLQARYTNPNGEVEYSNDLATKNRNLDIY